MVRFESLTACPLHGIADAFDFKLGLEQQPFPVRASWQREARLPDLPGQRITGIQATAGEHRAVLPSHLDAQRPRHAGDAIVGKPDHESVLARRYRSAR